MKHTITETIIHKTIITDKPLTEEDTHGFQITQTLRDVDTDQDIYLMNARRDFQESVDQPLPPKESKFTCRVCSEQHDKPDEHQVIIQDDLYRKVCPKCFENPNLFQLLPILAVKEAKEQ